MSGRLGGHARFGRGLLANQIQTMLWAENESGGGEDSGEHAIWSNHTDGLASVADGQAAARIENVAIAAAVDGEGTEIVAGGGDGVIGQSDGGPAFAGAIGFFQADIPGIFCRRMAGD